MDREIKMEKNKFVEMGYCTKPHGIKGSFQFILHNIDTSNIKKNSIVTLVPTDPKSKIAKDGEEFKIQKIQIGNKAIVELVGVSDRNRVEDMVPFKVFMDRALFSDIEEDEYYLNDLIAIKVYSTDDEHIGEITDFYDNGQQVVLVVKRLDGEINELPYVDAFFPIVDIDNKRIVMIIPEEI